MTHSASRLFNTLDNFLLAEYKRFCKIALNVTQKLFQSFFLLRSVYSAPDHRSCHRFLSLVLFFVSSPTDFLISHFLFLIGYKATYFHVFRPCLDMFNTRVRIASLNKYPFRISKGEHVPLKFVMRENLSKTSKSTEFLIDV